MKSINKNKLIVRVLNFKGFVFNLFTKINIFNSFIISKNKTGGTNE
ncbi:MAG: hypothetical protein PWP46_33 [Fusobacteriaceae bacterium]|nr:hypothetical protein [Fusobacteriaceae bacterium]